MFSRGILSNRLAHFSRYLVSPSSVQPPRFRRLVIPLKGDPIIFSFPKKKNKERERQRKGNTRQKRKGDFAYGIIPAKMHCLRFLGKTIILYIFLNEIFQEEKFPKRTTRYFHSLSYLGGIGNRWRNERESHSLDLRQVSSTFARAKHTLRKQGRRRRRRRRHAGFIPFRPFCTFHGEHRSWRGKADERGRVKRGRHRGEGSEAGEGESVDRREGNSLAASFPARLT